MRPYKVTIYGAGGTGQELAEALVHLHAPDIVWVDIAEDMTEAKRLDLWQSGAIIDRDVNIAFGRDDWLVANSDFVVITAGQGRKPGMTREDLLAANGRLIEQIARDTARLSPEAFIIVLTNPADILTRIAMEASGFPSSRVMGQGGILDSARMSTFVAETLGVSVRDVRSMVLGTHGDHMVPVKSCVSVHGIPVASMVSGEAWDAIIRRTRFGGGEIMEKFKTHGASITPGWAVAQMIDALTHRTPRVLPISTKANGAYGLTDTVIGLPALVSCDGVTKVLEIGLTSEEKTALHQAASALEENWAVWQSLNSSVR